MMIYVPEGRLETTPGLFVAFVLAIIVAISLLVEWLLHKTEHGLEHRKRNELLKAFDKLKEELLLLGFISLLMTLSEESIIGICIAERDVLYELSPCNQASEEDSPFSGVNQTNTLAGGRPASRLLAEEELNECPDGQVPFIARHALHQVHLFIFVLAVIHVLYSCAAMFLAITKVNQWRQWECEAWEELARRQAAFAGTAPDVRVHLSQGHRAESFIRRHQSWGQRMRLPFWIQKVVDWIGCFFRQFYSTVRRSDYLAMRAAFISTHNLKPDFDFHKYVKRCLENDFSKIVGLNWVMWALVVLYMSFDLPDTRLVYWLPILAFVLLLATGAKLVRTIQVLARDIDSQDVEEIGHMMRLRDTLFWFNRPHLVANLIYFQLFNNSLQISLFFFYFWQSGLTSCYLDTRTWTKAFVGIAIAIIFLIAYMTLPTYSLVSQMGSHFSGAIFTDSLRKSIKKWAKQARKTVRKRPKHGHTESEDKEKMLSEHGDLYAFPNSPPAQGSTSQQGVEMGGYDLPPPPYPGLSSNRSSRRYEHLPPPF